MELSKDAHIVMSAAYAFAVENRHDHLTPEHLLFAVLRFPSTRKLMASCDLNVEKLEQELLNYFDQYLTKQEEGEGHEPTQSHSLQSIIERTMFYITTAGKTEIRVGDLLVALIDEPESHAAYFLKNEGLDRLTLLERVTNAYREQGWSKSSISTILENTPSAEIERENKKKSDRGSGRNATLHNATEDSRSRLASGPLEQFTICLTDLALQNKLDPLIGRQEILDRTIQVLARRLKNNPIHIGDPGVGKTAITEGLAQRIVSGDVPSVLQNMKIYSLDMAGLIAGTRYRGDFESRMKSLVKELVDKGDSILFIDEIHSIIGAGSVSGGSMDASNLLKPALVRGEIRCIGSTTHDEFKKSFSKDYALARRFQKINVPATSRAETLSILEGIKHKYEVYHNVSYDHESLSTAIDLSDLYINERQLPDKAIDVIDEAGAWARIRYESLGAERLEKEEKQWHTSGKPILSIEHIEQVISSIAHIPRKTMKTDEKESLRHLEEHLLQSLHGQDAAVRVVCEAIKRSRAGFRVTDKPVGNFLFVGPTGVGKTELARSIARELGIHFHRFDMSEYQERHSVARLIGSPPGYIGYEEGGLLTDSLRKYPHSVLLFDEIEKAHSSIYNVLLQMMDYATLTDNQGHQADLRNVLIIMTSNAGAHRVGQSQLGFGDRTIDNEAVHEAIKETFTPEFRNRLDKIVPFAPLRGEDICEIAKKELESFIRLLEDKKILLKYSSKVLQFIAQKSYSEEFGARNLSRYIEEEVKGHLVDEVLYGKLTNGGEVVLSIKNDKICFRIKKQKISKEEPFKESLLEFE